MSQIIPDDSETSLFKVGAVIVQPATVDSPARFLVMRVKPKNEGETPPYTLPRGSRDYHYMDADGVAKQASVRDAETARAQRDHLESLDETLQRELDEEAGISPELLASKHLSLYTLGVRSFASGPHQVMVPVRWHVVVAKPEAVQHMNPNPSDTLEPVRWETLDKLKAMANTTPPEFSGKYLPVIEEAMQRLHDGHLQPYTPNKTERVLTP